MSATDEELLARYKQGDTHAFRELVERYSRPLYNLGFRLLHDPMEAENIVQEAFLRVIMSLDRVRLDLPFKPYLFRIAVNHCYDILRARRVRLLSDIDDAEEIAQDAPEILDRLEKQELSLRLHATIESLQPHYRTVIVLRYMNEFSYEEMAQTLNLPLNTVRTHLRRAKEQLKVKLQKSALEMSAQKQSLTLRVSEGS
jgi:RNA polymerase sigma-70 factor (ECF subfamily)